MSEIKPPCAEIISLGRNTKNTPLADDDIKTLCFELIALANRLDAIKDKTRFPEWTKNQADSMRDFANDIIK